MKFRTAILWIAITFPAAALVGLIGGSAGAFAPGGLIERWQTLVAGLLALVAAFIGGRFIREQIATADRHEGERQRRKFAAARAVLPLALSYLSEYAAALGGSLRELLESAHSEHIPHGTPMPALPELPQNVIKDFRDFIEASDAQAGNVLAELLSRIQVLTARLRSLETELANPDGVALAINVETYLLNAAEIYARAAALFEFARRETDELPLRVTAQEMRSALHQMCGWNFDRLTVYEAVDRRYPAA